MEDVMNSDPIVDLFWRINRRFILMREITLFKMKNHLPVQDEVRENLLVNEVIKKARQEGLEEDWTRGFILDLLTISRNIQKTLRDTGGYGSQQDNASIQDFERVRNEVLEITQEIVHYARLCYSTLKDPKEIKNLKKMYEQALTMPLLTQEDKAQFWDRLIKIRLK